MRRAYDQQRREWESEVERLKQKIAFARIRIKELKRLEREEEREREADG